MTMNSPTIVLLIVVAIALFAWFSSAKDRARRRRRREAARRLPRRQALLEKKMAEVAFTPVRSAYGEVFSAFVIMRTPEQVHMDVEMQPGVWGQFKPFIRALIIRHLFRTLAALSGGTVRVVLDKGTPDSMEWTAEHDAAFRDGGMKAPWEGRPGTMMSGVQPDKAPARNDRGVAS
jgi:hypothetical protein